MYLWSGIKRQWTADAAQVAAQEQPTMSISITVQVFSNGEALAEVVANVKAAVSEQDAVDQLFRHVRIDRQYRFLGRHGFILPTDAQVNSHLLFKGGKA